MTLLVDQLGERKNWSRYFPEGLIEFSVVLRVLALLLLGVLMIVSAGQRALVMTSMLTVLWADFALTALWAVQIAKDLDNLFDDAATRYDGRRQHFITTLTAVFPATIALLIIAPWPTVLIGRESTRNNVMHVLLPALGLLFLVSAYFAQRMLQRIRLARDVWTFLLMIPGLHWLAMHRLIRELNRRLEQRSQERGLPLTSGAGAAVVTAADVILVLAACFWVAWLALSMGNGAHLNGIGGRTVQTFGLIFGCVFAVTDVAAMESLQRRFVALVRKL